MEKRAVDIAIPRDSVDAPHAIWAKSHAVETPQISTKAKDKEMLLERPWVLMLDQGPTLRLLEQGRQA
jgi:hypothetical protein